MMRGADMQSSERGRGCDATGMDGTMAGAVDSIAVRRVWQQFSRFNPSV